MKIAIQGHPTRGNEVIQILENLGGENTEKLKGTYTTFYYIDDKNKIGDDQKENFPPTYKLYTLEEFEKEFPFKIGDEVVWNKDNYTAVRTVLRIDYSDLAGIKYAITAFGAENCFWEVDVNELKLYKKMKEERNITLTLDKAKEWYNKGGELKEVALQAFSEQELKPLPRSWEEYTSKITLLKVSINKMPISSLPKKYIALYKLERLRNCWWNGWEPEWSSCEKYVIKWDEDNLIVFTARHIRAFLVFPTKEMAEEFLECFRDLIKKAGDLI